VNDQVCEHGGLRRKCEICELRAELAQREWVSVKEKLPETNIDVLIYPWWGNECHVGYYHAAKSIWLGYFPRDGLGAVTPTHWTYKPPGPGEGKCTKDR